MNLFGNANTILVIYLILITLAVVLVALFSKFASKFVERKDYKEKNINLLNRSEFKLFTALSSAINSEMYICPKVRISDLVDVNTHEGSREFFSLLNKITSKHVDFVICNKSDFKPLAVFELDGPTHSQEKSIKRDKFVDDVFRQAGLPIYHIPVSDFYDSKHLANTIYSATHKT